MTDKPFSVNEALRFARHDFLNQLQLIKMNIDLARLEEAKAAIDDYTSEARAFYDLSRLNSPFTYEWLQTANWRYPGFQVNITSHIESACNPKVDQPIRDVFEEATKFLHPQLNPFIEQQINIHIECNSSQVKVTYEAVGGWESIQHEMINDTLVTLTHECKTTNKWRFHIEENKEG